MGFGGRPIVITRPMGQSDSLQRLIRANHGVPVDAPLIEIRFDVGELVETLSKSERFHAVVVTSANGVRALHEALVACKQQCRQRLTLYVIGRASARVAHDLGFDVRTFPGVKSANDLADALIRENAGSTQRWLIPQSRIADPAFATRLRDAGHFVATVPCYESVQAEIDEQVWREAATQGDLVIVLFFSPSAVKSFHRQCWDFVQPDRTRWLFACIGDTTRRACEVCEIKVFCTAEEPSEASLVKTVVDTLAHPLSTFK